MYKSNSGWLLSISLLVVTGCASNVPELIRNNPPSNIEIIEARLDPGHSTGTRVRWGGKIVALENLATHTLVELLGQPLSANGEPVENARSKGRFIARIPGFLDPEEYQPGRLLTVSGKLSGGTRKQIGEFVYDYPIVDVEARYLWPVEEIYPNYRDPFYDPWFPYWYPYRYPYRRW